MRRLLLLFALLECWVGSAGAEPDREGREVSPSPIAAVALPPNECPRDAPLAHHPLTLGEVVDLALCRHPQTRQSWAVARAAFASLGVAEAAFLPTVNGTASWSRLDAWGDKVTPGRYPYDQTTAGLSFGYLLFDFGTRQATAENARRLWEAASASQENIAQQVIAAAVKAYFQRSAKAAAVEATQRSERSAEQAFRAAEARHQAGSGTPADRLLAKTAHSQAILNRLRAEGELRNAQGTLAYAVGFSAETPLTVAESPPPESPPRFAREVASWIEEAKGRRPDLAEAEARLGAARASLDAARGADRPSVSLTAGVNRQRTAGEEVDNASVGVALSVPLFSGFAATQRIAGAQAELEAKEADRDRTALLAALEVWQSWNNLRTALQALEAGRDLLASAEQSERVALGRYQAGVGTIHDGLNAQGALASARQQWVQAVYDWNVARVTLFQAVGGLDRRTALDGSEGAGE
ncbi:MAG: TolC family protein [Magnetococcales bacterium]|nr:TolC family protein [Magnetococcales bacterium]